MVETLLFQENSSELVVEILYCWPILPIDPMIKASGRLQSIGECEHTRGTTAYYIQWFGSCERFPTYSSYWKIKQRVAADMFFFKDDFGRYRLIDIDIWRILHVCWDPGDFYSCNLWKAQFNLTHPLTGRCFTVMPRNVSWNDVLKQLFFLNITQ